MIDGNDDHEEQRGVQRALELDKNDRVNKSTSNCSQSTGSSLVAQLRRPPPTTPPSNFNIHLPDISPESSQGSSGDEEDIFPAGFRPSADLEGVARERWHQLDDQLPDNHQGGNGPGTHGSVFGENGTIHSAEIRRRRRLLEGRPEEVTRDIVLSVIWMKGNFAASYFDLETAKLFVLPEIADSPPDYNIMRSIYSQIYPTYVLASQNSDDRFMAAIRELTGNLVVGSAENAENNDQENDRNQQTGVSQAGLSTQLFILPGKDYNPDTCRTRVLALKLPFEPKNLTAAEHSIFMASLIPMANDTLIRCLGCLLKFLDRSAIELFQLEVGIGGHIQATDIVKVKMDDIVLVDDTAWQSLQIFSKDVHPSSFKQGSSHGSKEGLSVYSVLNKCATTQGSKFLRLMLLRPTRNHLILKRRYDVIDYCMHVNNCEMVASFCDLLKPIKSIPKLLHRLSLLHATVSEWKQLYQTLYHCLLLAERCNPLDHVPDLFKDIGNIEHINNLRELTQEMMRVINFERSQTSNRIVANEGLNEELDRRKKQFDCLPEIMAIVASEEVEELPAYVGQCCAVYIPEVGYLLAVAIWRENLTDHDLQIDGLDFRFRTHDLAYYKTPRMRELDVVLGDCSVAILEMETVLMVRLVESILLKSPTLQRVNELVSELDSLIAMSAVAKSNNFVRPITAGDFEKLKIVGGRHPISDLLCEFVSNSTVFKRNEKVVILTGPNASGKSVYLKQVAIIVLMALSGSFVPATFAQIPIYDKVCTRVHAVESVSSGFSSFMVDINQMSLALRSSSKNTLVIVDEFGKGTLEADGLSILTASIQDFIDREADCPTIFLCTHFTSISKHLKDSPLVKHQSMKYIEENNQLTYLYELIDGGCEVSFAAKIAQIQGIPVNVVQRADEVESVMRGTRAEASPTELIVKHGRIKQFKIRLLDDFLKMNLQEVNPKSMLRQMSATMDQLVLT